VPEALGRAAWGALAAGIIAFGAMRAGALAPSGAAAAVIVGTLVVAGGGWWAGVLVVAFFATSSALSALGKRARRQESVSARGSRRDAAQVLANGGVATALAVAAGLAGTPDGRALALAAFAGSVAAATADTWATEIGRFSRVAPRSVRTWRTVAPGVSGGITPLGTAASVAGAAFIGAVAAAGLIPGASPGRVLLAALVAGVAGSLADSLAGATVQAMYRCPACDAPTERRVHRCGTPTVAASGLRWVTNETVNVICALAGALVGAAVFALG